MSQSIEHDAVGGGFRGHRIFCSAKGTVSPFLIALSLLVMLALPTPSNAGSVPCDCETCHGIDYHGVNWQGCSGCHQSPPQDGTHLVHYNSAPQMILRYGDTTVKSTADAYKFGCGNCHPLDRSKHRDGTVEVELYDALAPLGSLKAKNPSTAAYDPATKTCSNVYCHSGYTVTSGDVGLPLQYPANPVPPGFTLNGSYIMDAACSNLTYSPYTVNTARDYKTTPPWGTTGTFTTCKECHAFPLTTYFPAVSAGVGDSHQWVNEIGYNYGHAYNMGYFGFGIPCATCHYRTADHRGGVPPAYPQTANPPTYWTQENGAWIEAYYPVPVKDRTFHVNGVPDVAFDTDNGYRYYYDAYGWYINNLYNFTTATYDAQTKTCSNVSCHFGGAVYNWQQTVKWGSPYRGWEGPGQECDVCHRNGYLTETCQPAP